MSMYDMDNPFSVCFNSMKIRYPEYDNSIDSVNFIHPDSKINVFISFESILNNISNIKDLDNKLLLNRNFNLALESEMFNVCAHYKRFFRDNRLDTKIYLYYTDLASKEFIDYKYTYEYRSFYINKFLNNPRFEYLGNRLVKNIVPKVQLIMDFIPNVYFIYSNGIDGSLIPYIIANSDKERKNFIVTSDRYETQYQLLDGFCVHYIKKSMLGTQIISDFESNINDMFKGSDFDYSIYKNRSFYSLLISILGNKLRSVDGLKGVGIKTISKYLLNGINEKKITRDTNNLELLLQIIPEDYRELCESNFKSLDIIYKYNELTDKNKFNIINQQHDRFDNNSLIKLNNEDYVNFPLMLPELTC